jgi:hypothetical protein
VVSRMQYEVQGFTLMGAEATPPEVMDGADQAVAHAKAIARVRVGAVAYPVVVNSDLGYRGEKRELFRSGRIPPDYR